MNNFEKIKAMNIDEMASFVFNSAGCTVYCKYINETLDFCKSKSNCKNGIKQWLESEGGMTNNINGIDVSEYFIDVVDESGGTVDYKILPNVERLLVEKIFEQNQQLKRLQEENIRLKKIKDDFFKQAEISHQAVQDKNKIIEKLETVIQETRNIIEKLITETPEYHSCYYKDECGDNCTPKKQSKVQYCCYENVDKILTIINEVLND